MSMQKNSAMSCWQCPRYNREARFCRDGKANPRSKADSLVVAETLGLRALCHYNLHRDAIAARAYFPNQPATRELCAPRSKRRTRRSAIEIEIETETAD